MTKSEMRKAMQEERPDMTDEEFENEWGVIEALGLAEPENDDTDE